MSVLDWLAHEAQLMRRAHPFKRARCWLLCESPELRRERETYARLSAEVTAKEHEHIERTGEFLMWERAVTDDEAAARELNQVIASAMHLEEGNGDDP